MMMRCLAGDGQNDIRAIVFTLLSPRLELHLSLDPVRFIC